MIQLKRFKRGFFLPLFLLLILCLSNCKSFQPKVCYKNGKAYCITHDWVPFITWDACYRRGLSCMEGECWEYAINEFMQAIELSYKDRRNVRAYGMHFRDEYFPHREMGISYFHLGRLEEASRELELSLNQTSSARAKYYLNQTRRSLLLATGQDAIPPVIHLEFPREEFITNQTPLQIKGTIRDDQFVAAILVNQHPLFIELAQPALPFTFSADLKEGWNTIEVIARDLVNRQDKKEIRVYLDQQGPLVIINPIQGDMVQVAGQIAVTALVYDRSGIVSFQLNHKEVSRLGLDRLCLIEETVHFSPDIEAIPFWTQDMAGNITKGEIPLFPARRRPNLALRLACSDPDTLLPCTGPLAINPEKEDILLDIINPPRKELTTCYSEIFLEGEIEAQYGIHRIEIFLEGVLEAQNEMDRIELKSQELSNINEIKGFKDKNWQALIQNLKSQGYDIEEYIQTFNEILQKNTFYYLNQKVPLGKEATTMILTLSAEDNMGNMNSKQFRIWRIPRERIFKSEQQMLLAIIPFDVEIDNTYNRDRQDYIYNTLNETFTHQERFNLVEQDKLPWYLLKKACKTGRMCNDDVVQQICENTSAEGIICGSIQKWLDGIEIKAVFREPEKGETLLFHDVFTPGYTTKDLKTIISGLAIKFRDSFPVCTGTIVEKEGQIIHVDIGSEKGLFPGMKYNIFKDEQELISIASIKKVSGGSSRAKVADRKKIKKIQKGYQVRTR